jgi:hypothetical protein
MYKSGFLTLKADGGFSLFACFPWILPRTGALPSAALVRLLPSVWCRDSFLSRLTDNSVDSYIGCLLFPCFPVLLLFCSLEQDLPSEIDKMFPPKKIGKIDKFYVFACFLWA